MNEIKRYGSDKACKILVGNKSDLSHKRVVDYAAAKVRMINEQRARTTFAHHGACDSQWKFATPVPACSLTTSPTLHHRNLLTAVKFHSLRPAPRTPPMSSRHSSRLQRNNTTRSTMYPKLGLTPKANLFQKTSLTLGHSQNKNRLAKLHFIST
jgi:hypothetical protein